MQNECACPHVGALNDDLVTAHDVALGALPVLKPLFTATTKCLSDPPSFPSCNCPSQRQGDDVSKSVAALCCVMERTRTCLLFRRLQWYSSLSHPCVH
eukprot:1137303-Pelagomonas_calceolata.AAC.2